MHKAVVIFRDENNRKYVSVWNWNWIQRFVPYSVNKRTRTSTFIIEDETAISLQSEVRVMDLYKTITTICAWNLYLRREKHS